MNFKKSVSLNFGSRVILLLINFLSSFIVLNRLGPEGNGKFVIVWLFTYIGVQFGILGLHSGNTYFVAKNKNISELFSLSLIISIVLGLCIGGLIYIINLFYLKNNVLLTEHSEAFKYALFSIPFLIFQLLIQGLLLGLKRIWVYSVADILPKAIFLVMVGLLLFSKHITVLSITQATFASNACIAGFYLIYFRKYFGSIPSFKGLKEIFLYSFKIYLSVLFAYLILRSDQYFVHYFHGDYSTGIYSYAVKFIDILAILPAVISSMFFTYSINDGKKEQNMWAVHKKTAIIMFIISIASFLLFPYFTKVFFPNFIDGISSFNLLLIAIYFFALSSIFSNYLAGKNLPRWIVYLFLLALVVNIILNILLIPTYNYNGAAVASIISYFMIWIIYYVKLSRERDRAIQ